MKIGVISDTHGFLDPQVETLFREVEHILHAGDIGNLSVIRDLESIAPVTAVAGNNDLGYDWPEREVVELGGWRFLIQHIVDPNSPTKEFLRTIDREVARVVVFGHTHRPHAEWREDRLFFNPGYAGKPRFNLKRSVALIELTGGELRHDTFWL